jgi:hypothetical protein
VSYELRVVSPDIVWSPLYTSRFSLYTLCMGVYAEWAMVGIGSGVVLWLACLTVQRARSLNRRIDDYTREQEAEAEPGRAADPYAALAELYAPESTKEARRPRN